MAGKGLIPYIASSSTFALSGEPSPANAIIPTQTTMLEQVQALEILPLAMSSPARSNGEPRGARAGSAEPPVRPNQKQPASAPRSTGKSLANRGTPGKRARSPGPNQGQRSTPRKAVKAKLFHGNDAPGTSLRPGEKYVGTLKSKTGNVVFHNYAEETYSPDSPSPTPRFRVVGVRTPNGGYGKGLMPGLSPKEKGVAESAGSSPAASKVRRHLSPPPIRRKGGQYESSEEKAPMAPSNSQLAATILDMRLENKALADKVAEGKIELDDLKADFCTFKRGLVSKMKRLFKAVGKEDIYAAPSP